MAKILLLETATEVCSVVMMADGKVLAVQEDLHCNNHAAALTPFIETCVQQSSIALRQLDAIALSAGPGSYTTLRVGASVAKGLCYALDKPLIAVDTLLALADAARQWYDGAAPCLLAPALDARRQEVWIALYDHDLRPLAPAQALVLENNSFEIFLETSVPDRQSRSVILSGNGSEKISSGIIEKKSVILSPVKSSAVYLAGLATRLFQQRDFQDVAYFEPFYMKPPGITTPHSTRL